MAHDQIVAHTGLSEVRYGTWRAGSGLKRAAVRGTARNGLIEAVGSELVRALERHASAVPFAAADRHECWLLEAGTERPLALLGSAQRVEDQQSSDPPRWYPGQASVNSFSSTHGDARTLADLGNGAGAASRWVRRDGRGGGWWADGQRVPAGEFPELLLRERWDLPQERALVRDFLEWQAPWLLQLRGLSEDTRQRLETAAWSRAKESDRVHRLFPCLLDPQGLEVARVKARLLGDGTSQDQPAEPFLPFVNE